MTTGYVPTELAEQLVRDRRHLHAYPELAFEEHRTARFVAERLEQLGLEVRSGVAETGVVGLIRGGRAGRTVLLRADFDGLPIQEENEVPYRSQVPGVMHACGHDGHTAILLGAARLLSERRERLAGNVKLVFQPAEERPPGGAIRMIAEGVMDDPKVDAVLGLHVVLEHPVGRVLAGPGAITAASDHFGIEIRGRGGHAATPHLCVDPVLIAAQVIVALNTLVGREVRPRDSAVITVGTIHAGTAANVTPDSATLSGIVRTYDPELRQRLARRIEEVATTIAASMQAEARVEYEFGYPPVVNDPTLSELVSAVAREVVGEAGVIDGDPIMAADDMAYFHERAPGCFLRLGVANPARGLRGSHHQPHFDLDEAALPLGLEILVRSVERYLAD